MATNPEIVLRVRHIDDRESVKDQMLGMLAFAGMDVEDLVFSGYAEDGLSLKKRAGESGHRPLEEPPEGISDDAILIYFTEATNLNNTGGSASLSPAWHALLASSRTGKDPRLDVYDATAIYDLLPPEFYWKGFRAWLTPEQLDSVRLGTFVIREQSRD